MCKVQRVLGSSLKILCAIKLKLHNYEPEGFHILFFFHVFDNLVVDVESNLTCQVQHKKFLTNFNSHLLDRLYTYNKTMVFYFMPVFFRKKGYSTPIRPGLTNVEIRYRCLSG